MSPTRPAALRWGAWLWMVSAVPGASAALLAMVRAGDFPADDPLSLVPLLVTFVIVWGARVLCAVLILRDAGTRPARIVLVAVGLLAALTNDPAAWVISGGDPLVVTLVLVDAVLVIAGTVALFRPAVNAHLRPVPLDLTAAPPGWRPTNTMAILALVFAFVFAPLGAVFGFVARSQMKRTGEAGAGFALAGIIVGLAYTLLTAVLFTVVLVLGSRA